MASAAMSPEECVAGMLAAAEDFRCADYERLAAEARATLSPEVLIRDVYAPVLREAGDRWERGDFSVVQEHLLTACLRRELAYSLDTHNRCAAGPCIAFTTLAGERHELGSLMLAVIGASRGCRAIWLGPDLPVAEIGRFCGRVRVAAVAISLVTSPGVIDAPTQLAELRRALPPDTPIWLGGVAAASLRPAALPANTLQVPDLAAFHRLIAELPEDPNR